MFHPGKDENTVSENIGSPSSVQDMTSPVAWALAYASRGVDVFPCAADKHPLTPNGFLDATRDPAIIKAWWTRHPCAEPAWRVPPNVVVVDLDEKHGKHGVTDFTHLEECDPRDVFTPIATTPSGGLQLVYDAAGKVYQNKVAIGGTGIDTRTAGGYVVLPATGNGRKWLRRLSSTPLAPAPVWLDCATKQESPAGAFLRPEPASRANSGLIGRTLLIRAVRLIMTAPRGAQEETRHRQTYFIGALIAAGAVDYEVAYRALVAAANAMPAYGKPWRNLDQRVAASLARGMREGSDV
jgi:hypothetical protein